VHLQKGEFSRAINHLRIADAFLELTHYPLALARTRSNLGVAHLQAGAYDDARSILRDAENLQRALGDERGLIVTQHNLREIDKRLRE
jgi:Flp pilus assembly protein TadD